jgi:SAM-dependent methyltransferase
MAEDYYASGYHGRQHRHLLDEDEYFHARAEASARLYFNADERRKTIFEYGCGIGQGIAALPNAAGWDISPEARAACKRRGLRVFDDLESVEPKRWDIVFCRHVLEHVGDPIGALRAMRRLVADGGELYLILPREPHGSVDFKPDLARHLFSWNFRTANNLLDEAGFEPYVNQVRYVLGYRALLPLRRIAGPVVYLHAAKLVGRLLRNGELVLRARPKSRSEG